MSVTEVTETEIYSLILCSMIALRQRLNRLEADAIRFDHYRMYTRGNVAKRPLPTVGDFHGV